jgi:SAM-dependent methyltransferase
MPKKNQKKDFWNTQYKSPTHLTLSDEPSEDLEKFTRYLMREHGMKYLNVTTKAVDLGCGNGRNLIFLAKEFGVHGLGYDTSKEAVMQARKNSEGLQLSFQVGSIADPIPLPDSSVMLALDMMSSHILRREERERLRAEIFRVLKPNGWLFFKSFLLDDDLNAERMLRENPGPEEGMYLHPEIGAPEYVWTEHALREFFGSPAEASREGGNGFTIHKIEKSFKHRRADGSAWKRRTVSAYLQKS